MKAAPLVAVFDGWGFPLIVSSVSEHREMTPHPFQVPEEINLDFASCPAAGCPTHSRSLRMSGMSPSECVGRHSHESDRGYPHRMTKGLLRYYGTDDLHFITWSCYRRQPLLRTAMRRDLFLRILEDARRKYRFVVHGYVVMPEHFHLLITEPEAGDPSVVMKVLKQRFARQLKRDPNQRLRNRRFWENSTPSRSGRSASTISACGANASASRSCATCIEIP